MKRVLAFILVLSMVLGSVGMVFADSASDIAGHKNEKAILRLNNLGIVEGDDRGFAPDDYITRAEFAVLVVRALGLEGSANVSKGDTAFTDVTVAGGYEWASGAINVATKLGYIQGYGGGLFGPADNIRYEDAITLIVRVLGYEPVVQTKGGYPIGYLVVAEQDIDITDHVDGVVGVPITRGAIFQLLDNALTKALMIQVGYGDDAKFVVSGTDGTDKQTILTDRLGLELIEGIVTEIARVGSLKDNRIKIDNKVYKVVGDVDYEEVFGTEVEAWMNDDDEIVYVEIVSDEIYLDAIEWNSAKDQLKLVDDGTKYDLARRPNIFIDGKTGEVEDLGEKYKYAKVVLDDDGDVAFIDAYNWDDFLVVEEVDGYDILGYGDEIDAEDYVIVKDGKTISLDDLEEGDILFYNDSAEYAEVYNDFVEGEIDRIYDDRIRVEGKDYKIDGVKYINEDGDIVDLAGSKYKDVVETMQDAGEVAVFLNRVGDMVFLSGDLGDLVTSSKYVFVTEASDAEKPFEIRGTEYYALDVMNAEGKIVKYDVKKTDVTKKNLIEDSNTWDIVVNDVIELSLDKDGDIDEIRLLEDIELPVDSDDFKVTSKYVEGNRINTDAVVFLAEDYIDDTDDLDVDIYSKLDFDYIKLGKAYVKNDKVVAFVVKESSREDDSVSHYTVATADSIKVSGKQIWTLKLVIDGKKVTLDTKEKIKDFVSVAKGDLLKVKIDKKTDKINEVNFVNKKQIDSGEILKIKTSDKSLELKGGETYKLGADAVVVDSTDSYKVISLSSLKAGDNVKVAKVSETSKYVEVVVKLKKGVTVDPGVTYIVIDYNATFGRFDVEDKYGKKSSLFVEDFGGYELGGVEVSEAVMLAWLAEGTVPATIEVTKDNKLIVEGPLTEKTAEIDGEPAPNKEQGGYFVKLKIAEDISDAGLKVYSVNSEKWLEVHPDSSGILNIWFRVADVEGRALEDREGTYEWLVINDEGAFIVTFEYIAEDYDLKPIE